MPAFRRTDAVPTLGCSERWVPVTAASVFIPGVTRGRGRPRQSGPRGAVLRPRPRLTLSHSGGLCSPGLVSPSRARTSRLCLLNTVTWAGGGLVTSPWRHMSILLRGWGGSGSEKWPLTCYVDGTVPAERSSVGCGLCKMTSQTHFSLSLN